MKTGSIKWFSPSKGYGFITDDDGRDLFLHYSGLNADQDRRLFPGDRVEFEDVEGEKGRKATSVRCIERIRDAAEPPDSAKESGSEREKHTAPEAGDSDHGS